ncbi:MAG: sulfite exporter TauE/SafE family protein [Candidatus Tyrphobacter sp.]
MITGVELFVAAFLASIFGSMVGLGGGFILVPVLRLFFGLGPADAAGTALVLVVANSLSGSITYLLQHRVHVRLGLLVAAGGWPGSIAGAVASQHISPTLFDVLLAAILVYVSLDMLLRRRKTIAGRQESQGTADRFGGISIPAALGIGFGIGMLSSLFGIGGGTLLVPAFLYFSDLPAHAIGATSHFAIVLTSPVGLAAHAVEHDIRVSDIAPLVIGGLCGGPLGARLSLRLASKQLLVVVAVALFIGAASLVAKHA